MNNFSDDMSPDENLENRTLIGRIERVIPPDESNLGYWCVDVTTSNNARFEEIIYSGWIQFDPETQQPHGVWIPPKKFNAVMITFIDERPDYPAMVSAAPMATRNSGLLNYEQMKKLHSSKLLGDEVALFHSAGHKMSLKSDEITIQKGDKILTIKDDGIYCGDKNGTPDKVISYTKLNQFLQTVVGNLGGPIFPTGIPESVTFDDFFGGI